MKKVAKKAAPKKPRAEREPEPDMNQLAQHLVRMSTEEVATSEVLQLPTVVPDVIKQYMAALGRKGGKIGGRRRAESMTQARRIEIASSAAKERCLKGRSHFLPWAAKPYRAAPGQT